VNFELAETTAGIFFAASALIIFAATWRLARRVPSHAGWAALVSLSLLLVFLVVSEPLILWRVAGTPDGKPTALHNRVFAFTQFIGPSLAALTFAVSLLRVSYVATRPNKAFKPTSLHCSA
jgi:quinol-cytochrome oxidoreductase complex cytochrome b subunit